MRKLMLLTVLVVAARVAQADSGLFYLGAGISSPQLRNISDPQGEGRGFYPNLDDTSWKVFAGFRPISWFAVEADYLPLGDHTKSFNGNSVVNWHSEAKAFAGYAVGFLPIPVPSLDVYGKAGFARWKLDTSGSSSGIDGNYAFEYSDQGTSFAWGVGAQAHIGKFGGRVEYEGFSVANTNGARIFSLSVASAPVADAAARLS